VRAAQRWGSGPGRTEYSVAEASEQYSATQRERQDKRGLERDCSEKQREQRGINYGRLIIAAHYAHGRYIVSRDQPRRQLTIHGELAAIDSRAANRNNWSARELQNYAVLKTKQVHWIRFEWGGV
jgi:hypothetical protein